MSADVSIRKAYKPVTVDLYDEFETVDLSRGESQKLEALQEKWAEAETEDGRVEIYAKALDIRLNPTTGSKKASTIVRAKYKSGELSYRRLREFVEDLNEATDPQIALIRQLVDATANGDSAEEVPNPT